MAKSDKFYFENFAERAVLSKKAAIYLVECLESYNPDEIETMMHKMHEIEHTADIKKHEMNDALAKAFVTPVDREDLDMLSANLDHVTDSLEEIMQKFYIYNVSSVTPPVIEFAKKLVSSCEQLCALMDEFENFKRSKKIHELIVALNDAEEECDKLYLSSMREECDKLYLSSMRELTKSTGDVLTIISWREIYECFEACSDACEHVSECVGSVIMKNT